MKIIQPSLGGCSLNRKNFDLIHNNLDDVNADVFGNMCCSKYFFMKCVIVYLFKCCCLLTLI